MSLTFEINVFYFSLLPSQSAVDGHVIMFKFSLFREFLYKRILEKSWIYVLHQPNNNWKKRCCAGFGHFTKSDFLRLWGFWMLRMLTIGYRFLVGYLI